VETGLLRGSNRARRTAVTVRMRLVHRYCAYI